MQKIGTQPRSNRSLNRKQEVAAALLGGGGAIHGNAQAKRALDVLDSSGLAVTAELRAELEAALIKGEAGTEKEQCCCALSVFILYLGRAPADEEDEWWMTQYNALGGREGGLIDIT